MRMLSILVSLFIIAGSALGKPPDLPVDLGGTCIADTPAGAEERPPALVQVPAASPTAGLCLDLFTPCLCQLLADWWPQLAGTIELPGIALEIKPARASQEQAHNLFQRAERHFQVGNASQALQLYRRVQALAPTSAWSQRAQQRQRQIEMRNPGEAEGSEEAQEAPPSSPYKPNAVQNMLENTIPLETFLDEPVSLWEEEAGMYSGPGSKWILAPSSATGPGDKR